MEWIFPLKKRSDFCSNVPPDNVQCISFLLHNFLCGRRTKSPQSKKKTKAPKSASRFARIFAASCSLRIWKCENLDFPSNLVGSTDSHTGLGKSSLSTGGKRYPLQVIPKVPCWFRAGFTRRFIPGGAKCRSSTVVDCPLVILKKVTQNQLVH